MVNLEFMKKLRPEELCIKEFKHWIVCVRQRQVTLGDVVIALKRQTESVSDMLPEESTEFPEVIKWYEEICKEKFGAIKFNYMVLMMKDNFVHYHAFPRYDKKINLFDIVWEDIDFPVIVNIKNKEVSDDELLFKIRDYMN